MLDSQRISLQLEENSYDIIVKRGLKKHLHEWIQPWYQGQRCVLISQNAIFQHHAEVYHSLKDNGINIESIIIPDDELAKNLHHADTVWAKMVELGCDRSSLVIALGGGVVGDLSGFCAACYMRGIDYIQVPTTLLAMIDSSIGGKTAVNLSAGKNLVGAVYQPKAVLIDPDFLQTLSARSVVSSLGEAVKYGLIRDADMFASIEKNLTSILNLSNLDAIDSLILKSCAIKSDIVSNDPFEHAERKLLNFGHTIGHALETMMDYSQLQHGEAVLYGMQCAAHISWQKGLISQGDFEKILSLLRKFPLPELQNFDVQTILRAVSHDKKNINGTLHFILIDAIGNGVINREVTEQEIVRSLEILNLP